MKVLAINGSPHKEGNTYWALKKVTDTLQELGIETEIIQVGNKEIRGCMGCGTCSSKGECIYSNEDFRKWTQKMYEADGLIVGSPVYYAGMAGTLKSFMDRAFYQSNGRMENKIGAGLAVCRRTGGMTTFEQINAYFLISDMFIAPSTYWNVGHGRESGEIKQDLEAMSTFEVLARNMAWFLRLQEETAGKIPPPEKGQKIRTNFIR